MHLLTRLYSIINFGKGQIITSAEFLQKRLRNRCMRLIMRRYGIINVKCEAQTLGH